MKKRAYIMICIALLCVACMAAVHITLLGTADQAEFDLSVYVSDASAAEGITLTMHQSSYHQLFWDTRLRLTDPENPETQFTARSTPKPVERMQIEPAGLVMRYPMINRILNFGSIGLDTAEWRQYFADSGAGLSAELKERIDALSGEIGSPFNTLGTEENRYLLEAVLDAADQTEAGATREVNLPLKQYLDHVPYQAYLELGNFAPGYDRESQFASASGERIDLTVIELREKALAEAMREYFRFPVPDDAQIKITVTKKDVTHVTKLEIGFLFPTGHLMTSSEVTAGKCWFIPWLDSNEPLDFSASRGGYALYCLPFTPTLDAAGRPSADVETDAMHIVLPLEENEKVISLQAVSLLGGEGKDASAAEGKNTSAAEEKDASAAEEKDASAAKGKNTSAAEGEDASVAEDDTILLVLQVEKHLELVLVDSKTETVRQRFTLFSEEEWKDRARLTFQPLGNKLFVVSGSHVHYYESDASGCYQLLLHVPDTMGPVRPEELKYQTNAAPAALAWDGERLVIANLDHSRRYTTSNSELLIGVYDATGLRYLAGIKSGPMQPTTIGSEEKSVVWGEYNSPRIGALELAFD
ncbi:MAG: hypothetical protein IJ773_14455 [Lachnospiraceae bacterium]|nr:hypothetical protein [Lachnospiraceae bacterium]